MKKAIKVGLASYGMSGKIFHAPFLEVNPNFILKKIVERSPKGSKNRYPEVETVKDFENLLDDREIELVVVNIPDKIHYDFCKKALLSGKHVVVEKPFTITTEEGEELINLAKKENLILSVFQNRRWDGDFLTVKKIISNKWLGRLVEFESHFDRYRNYIQENTWKEEVEKGTGILYNLGSHLIDQALVLFGKPGSVTADLDKIRTESKVIDYFDLRLDYDNVKVILRASYLVREPGPRFILHGTEGSFIKFGIDPQEQALNEGKLPVGEDWGKEEQKSWGLLNTNLNGNYLRDKIETLSGNYHIFYDNIYHTIREKGELFVKPEEALDVIRVIEAAIKSSYEGRKVIM
jgi:scyllo-inositol 2-dehydrogenase (NADP+)